MTAIPATSTPHINYADALDKPTKMLILVGVLLSMFLSSLDQTIVSTALPRIVSDLQGIDLLAWVSTAYLLASTAMVPIYGKLSDIYGRKIILLFGITVFLLGSVLCGMSNSMLLLVIFRGLQGFGAAAMTSTAFAIPADLFAPAERARYTGLFVAVFGFSSVLGPLVGGLLTDNISWHWVFFVNLPIGLVALSFIIAKMPKLDSGIRHAIDYAGAFTLLLTVIPFLLALTLDKNTYAWSSPLILGLLGTSAVGLVLFLFAETRASSPILPLHLFKNRTYTLANLIGAVIGATMIAAIIFLSLYLINVIGVSATEAGSTLIPLTLSLAIGSMIASQIVQRIGRYKYIIIVGLVLINVALWWLTTLTVDTSIWMVRARMVVLGLGLGPAMSLLTLAIQNTTPRQFMGAATASRQFFMQMGQVISSAIFGVVLTTTLTTALTANLDPIRKDLPAEMAARLDPQALRNGSSASAEGATGKAANPAASIEQSITTAFTTQRELMTRAIRDADPAAIAALTANPQTPAELKALLANVGKMPAPMREQALTKVLAGLDTAQAQALVAGKAIGVKIEAAIKNAFTDSIVQIYRYASFLAMIALVLSLFIPDQLLRQSHHEPIPALVLE